MKKLSFVLLFLGAAACVPKQQFDDQQAKLKDAQTKLRSAEAQAQECDPNTFIQLKEQSQSLDLLTQELVDRNTELSKEVARLRSVETSCKAQEKEFISKIEALEKDSDAKADRVRRTYEDLVRELRNQIKGLEEQIEAAKAKPAPKPAPKSAAQPGPKPKPAPKK